MSLLLLSILLLVCVLLTQIVLAPIDWITTVRLPSGIGLLVGFILVSWCLGESRS
jgi:hypothetical protein